MYESDVLRTDVDDFISLVRKSDKISIPEAARQLKVDVSTIEQWTDFLEEEKILGRDYKFTTAYVYYNQMNPSVEGNLSFETKEEFYRKAMNRNIPQRKIKILWLRYLEKNKERIKLSFFKKAGERNVSRSKVSDLWEKYYSKLME